MTLGGDNIKKACENIGLTDFQKRCAKLANEEESVRLPEKSKKKEKDIKKILVSKGIYEGYFHCGFSNFISYSSSDKEAVKKLQSLQQDCKGTILLLGRTGNGKTHLAIATVKSVPNSFYTSSKKMLIDYRGIFQGEGGSEQRKLEKYISYNLLVIDEVDRISLTPAEKDFLFLVIEERQARGKATIIISNKTLHDLSKWAADEAFMRRLASGNQFIFDNPIYNKS